MYKNGISKLIILLDNTPNEPSKFQTKNLVEINDESQGTCNKDNEIKFKTLSLFDYSDAYILAEGTMTVAPLTAAAPNSANKR